MRRLYRISIPPCSPGTVEVLKRIVDLQNFLSRASDAEVAAIGAILRKVPGGIARRVYTKRIPREESM